MARDLVCFDLDGTLLEPGGSIRGAIQVALQENGHAPFTEDDSLIGMDLRSILRLRSDDGDEVESMVHRFREVYASDTWRLATYVPGVLDVVDAVRSDGMQTAIVTTKGEAEAQALLSNLGIRHLFDTIVGDDDVRPIKPDPAPIIAACGRLGRHPRDACMVGDTVFDVEAGRVAGTFTVGVLWGHGRWDTLKAAGADAIVADADALLEAIRAWAA